MDFDTKGGNVLLFKLARKMSLDEGCLIAQSVEWSLSDSVESRCICRAQDDLSYLASTTIAHQDKLEGGDCISFGHVGC